jgi:aromatic ring-opening dioxygenase catalytic subunit (LigB family)
MTRFPTFFISHGGGPWPWMRDEWHGAYDRLEAALRRVPEETGARPRAVLMVSAHWEEPAFTAQAHPQPGMIYDYGGFPDYTYQISYPAAGSPELAGRARELLAASGIPAREDAARGFDHGMFAPMAVIYPQADMPTVQLSLQRGLDPRTHLAAGRALAPLRDEGVLIVGSGLSYHNLRAFGPTAKQPSAAFDAWLDQSLAATGAERSAALTHWEQAPSARQAHPREEHLLPLMIAVGAAEDEQALRIYHEDTFMGGISVSNWRFGPPAADRQ